MLPFFHGLSSQEVRLLPPRSHSLSYNTHLCFRGRVKKKKIIIIEAVNSARRSREACRGLDYQRDCRKHLGSE